MSGKRKQSKNVEGSGGLIKKRKVGSSAVSSTVIPLTCEADLQDSVPSPSVSVAESDTSESKQYVFKDPNFVHSSKHQTTGKKGRSWKNLKQIIQMERSLSWKPDHPLYNRIDAPPSFKPAKKYSDLSGLPSLYTDPMTKLRYSSAEEYARASKLPSDIVSGLLQLRKANNLVT